MLILLRKYHIALCSALVLLIVSSVVFFGNADEVKAPSAEDVIVIDPGHGGMDGGAVGATGVLEKNINLSIALKLKDIAAKDGKKVIMTRDTDTSLHTTESSKIRTQKRSDLANRKKILEENPGAIFVSIHQNKFEQSKYRGAQVFCADNKSSEELGAIVQKTIIDEIADGNSRVAKKITNDVYLLKGVKSTAIIVECGFLSNPGEEKLLCENTYQTKIAQAIYDGICAYKK